MKISVPFFRQNTDYTCGPACLRMIFAFHGKNMEEGKIAELAKSNCRTGTPDKAMLRAARMNGFSCRMSSNAHWTEVVESLRQGMPVLIKYIEPTDEDRHFSLMIGIKAREVILHDPWNGQQFTMNMREMKRRWLGNRNGEKDRGWMMTVRPRLRAESQLILSA